MAKPSRHPQLPRCFFVTSSTWEGRALFQSEQMAKLFVEVLFHYRNEHHYLLHEFVVLPDHFHLLITLDSAVTVERAIQLVKGGYSFRAGKELGFKGEVWQRGFTDHRIRDGHDFETHRKYIHENPVKKGLARSPEKYPYGSAYGGFELDLPPPNLRG